METTATEQDLGQGQQQEPGRTNGHHYATFLRGSLLEYAVAVPKHLATPALEASAHIAAMAQQGLCNCDWNEWMPLISEPHLSMTEYALQWIYNAGCATIAAAEAAGNDCDEDLSVVHWMLSIVQDVRSGRAVSR